ncbi:MAG: acyltransferase [Burkholderiaceae bacterium]|nr:acyltransferase [Burkholderiaceae bacterium]
MLKNIQTLRFLAALWVVLHHMQSPVTPFTLSMLPDAVTQLGFAGVDLFFVISGLIMAETTRGLLPSKHAAMRFLAQRFGRIYIGWWPFFGLYFLGAWQSGRLHPDVDLWGSFLLWPQDLTHYLLPITWTLSFELYFYVTTAALIAWNRRHAPLLLSLCGIAIIALNIWFYQRGLYLPANEGLAKTNLLIPFYLSPLTLEFIAGFLLAEWLHRYPRQCLSCWLAGAVLTLTLAFLYQSSGTLFASGMAGFFHVCERATLLGGFACCLVACAMEMERRNITPWRFLQGLGDASYSIYLAHIFCLIVVGSAFFRLQPFLHLSATAWSLSAIALTVGVSWLNYSRIESPLNRQLKGLLVKILG